MKFPRTTKLFRGQLDPAPLLCVLFPMAFFLLFHTFLVTPGGARLLLPDDGVASALPAGEPVLVVAIDAFERVFFENQLTTPERLRARLQELTARAGAPKLLVIEADQSVRTAMLAQMAAVARTAGLREVFFRANTPASSP